MALTTTDKLGIANLGLQGLSGFLSGADDSNEELQQQMLQQQRDDELFSMLLSALADKGQLQGAIQGENLSRARSFTDANPLGAENDYRRNNALTRAGLEAFSGRQLARPVPSLAQGFMNRPGVREALADSNVDEAIRQRRIATAGLDPRAQMQIGGAGSDYASQLFGDIQSSNAQRESNLQQQMDLISGRRQELAAQLAAQQEKDDDGPGFWRKLGGGLLTAAGIGANFIPGVGPIAGTLIGAATGAGGGALAGGRRGAAIGAGIGAGASYGLSRAGLGEPSRTQSLNNQMSSQSLPFSMQPAHVQAPGEGQLNLQASAMPWSPAPSAVPNHRPNLQAPRPTIQQALARPPQRGEMTGNLMGINPDMTTRVMPRQNVSVGRFMDAKVGGGPMTMNQQDAMNYGNVAGPAMNTSLVGAAAPLVMNPATATIGAGLAANPRMQQLLTGAVNQAQRLGSAPAQRAIAGAPQRLALPPGPQALGSGRPIAGILPQHSQSAQQIAAKLLETMKAYNSGSPADIKASQDLARFIQTILQGR